MQWLGEDASSSSSSTLFLSLRIFSRGFISASWKPVVLILVHLHESSPADWLLHADRRVTPITNHSDWDSDFRKIENRVSWSLLALNFRLRSLVPSSFPKSHLAPSSSGFTVRHPYKPKPTETTIRLSSPPYTEASFVQPIHQKGGKHTKPHFKVPCSNDDVGKNPNPGSVVPSTKRLFSDSAGR